VSREIARVMARCGVPEARLSVIHSGIDPALYAAAAATPPPECPVLGVVGALTPQKGVAVFLEALAELERRAPGWAGGPGGRRRAAGPRLRARPRPWAGRAGDVHGLARERGRAGRAVRAGRAQRGRRGSSATIKEVWAARRPVVCSDLPSNLELVEPGTAGWPAPGATPRPWPRPGAAVRPGRAGRGPGEALVRGGAGRLELFTEAAMARGYLELYARLSA
jgi:glycosyltransferase involved in cell wall biosynthesis